MATYSSILAWEIPGTEEPEGHSPWEVGVCHKEADTTQQLNNKIERTETWEVHNIIQEAANKTIPKEKARRQSGYLRRLYK